MSHGQTTTREAEWFFECSDPRHPDAPSGTQTRIVIRLSAARHILEKHVRPTNPEPWEDLLGEQGRQHYRQDPEADPIDLVMALGEQIQRCLAKPQAMLAWQSQPLAERGPQWHLVLPCGALAVLGCDSLQPQTEPSAWLKTCFFPQTACERTFPEHRWGATALDRLRYCFDFNSSDSLPRMAPTQDGPVRVGTRELWRIRFVTPETWWFDADQRLRPRSRTTWDGREGRPPAHRKLAPRRQILPDSQPFLRDV